MRNYASNSTINVSANVHRLGYYYYDVRLEGQNFISDYNEISSITKKFAIKEAVDVSYSQKSGFVTSYGQVTGEITNSEDPYLVFNPNDDSGWISSSEGITYDGDRYQYLRITMATDPEITGASFYYSTDSDTGFLESRRVNFSVYGTGSNDQAVTYMVPMFTSANYKGTIDQLRFDFNGSVGAKFKITKFEMVEVDNGDYPQGIQVVRDFLIYSDKMHAFTQFTATQEVDNITEMGVELKLAKSTVSDFVVKADGTKYENSLAVSDWSTAEYAGFVINGVGVIGYIMPADNSGGTLTVTEEGDNYVIRQTLTPENGTIIPSTAGMVDEEGNKDPNGNDIFMGQRIYTDDESTLAKFIVEAENERNPIPESNILVSEDSDGGYWGYDAIRGIYKFNIDGFGGFNEQYFTAQNRHFKLNFTINGLAEQDRDIWVLAYCPKGMLECAVLLDANEMMIPVPLQVGKNFSEAHGERNKFNLDDPLYSETIFPMDIKAGSTNEYTLLNLYQNWGQNPLKQLSWIQYSAPYYHLSTGATETNCIVPVAISGPHLPDHRGMSSPLWAEQPQHNSCGSHKWLQYTDAAGNSVKSMNTTDNITSYGPNYAELDMNFVTSDGKMKATYTHMEMPQTDENRTYYTLKYEVVDDIDIQDFKNDFVFYSVGSNDTSGKYTRVGYLNKNNESTVVTAQTSGNTKKSYVLGSECPYFSYFDMDGASSQHNQPKGEGYSNVAFLVYNSEFTIGGEKVTPNFIINDLGGRISISLNLDSVTLKAGDTFTINAILLPWGSQEMEGLYDTIQDQNVRDVRANTLLDPIVAAPVADALVENSVSTTESVASAFLPRVKTTNGAEAIFTLSGGENNQVIRVDGFTKLTDPKIYELKDGVWRAYEVCSAFTPDANNVGHAYDGYGVYYDKETGTYSYTFVVDMTGDANRTFKVVANEAFDGWENSVADSAITKEMNVLAEGEDLYNLTKNNTQFTSVIKNPTDEGFDYVRYTSVNNAKAEAYFYIFEDEDADFVTGNYIVVKYRAADPLTKWMQFYVATTSKSAGGSAYTIYSSQLPSDDEWHLMVIDIKAFGLNSDRVIYDDYGRLSLKHLRFDVFNETEKEVAMDIAYVVIADSLSEIFAHEQILDEAYVLSHSSRETPGTLVKEDSLQKAEISLGNITVNPDDLFLVPVKIKGNSGFSYLDIAPNYDKDLFTFMGYMNGDVMETPTVKGSRFTWTNTENSVAKDGTLMYLAFKAKVDLEVDKPYELSVKVIDANTIDGKGFNTEVVAGSITFKNFIYGNASGKLEGPNDGPQISSSDVIALRKYIAGVPGADVDQYGADANCDGVIDTNDLVLIRKYLANYNYDTGECDIILGPQISDSSN